MIVGIGTDICDVERLQAAVTRTGERFLAKVFTPSERRRADATPHPARELARCFAVKEATFKVLGRGWPYDVGFDEVELAGAAPCRVVLHGRAARWAETAGIARFHAAVSGDEHLVVAFVVGEDA